MGQSTGNMQHRSNIAEATSGILLFSSVFRPTLTSPSIKEQHDGPAMPPTLFAFGTAGIAGFMVGIITLGTTTGWAQTTPPESSQQLVREVVYNELHDHDQHGYWSYRVLQHVPEGTQVSVEVETPQGPITRAVLSNGHPLDPTSQREEKDRLMHLLNSPSEQANHRQAYADDEKRISKVLAMLPDAFQFTEAGTENGCRHLRFRPNPDYAPHTMEARVFRALSGDLWIDARMKRMTRLEGRLEQNVDFGFGVLGRVNRGSWFRMDRTRVSPTEWKTNRLEVHISGRALFFKTIGRETSEVRTDFTSLPTDMNLARGLELLERANASATSLGAAFAPVSFGGHS